MEEQKEPLRQELSAELLRQINLCLGMSIASLVLGIISIPMSIALIGLPLGIIGLILAIVVLSMRCRLGRGIAIWGLCLSVIGILASIFCGYLFYYKTYETYKGMAGTRNVEFKEWIGKASPDFNVTDLNGKEIKLSDLKGKRVILDFWATWCPPCKKEIPHFIKLRSETDPNQLVIIGISSEPNEILKKFVSENKINYSIASSENLPPPYDNIMSIPTTFFIDRNGIIKNILSGYHDFDVLHENALSDYNEPNILPLIPSDAN